MMQSEAENSTLSCYIFMALIIKIGPVSLDLKTIDKTSVQGTVQNSTKSDCKIL